MEKIEYNNVDETCPHCLSTHEYSGDLGIYRCKSCGKWIVNCRACTLDNSCKNCPLEFEAHYRNKIEGRNEEINTYVLTTTSVWNNGREVLVENKVYETEYLAIKALNTEIENLEKSDISIGMEIDKRPEYGIFRLIDKNTKEIKIQIELFEKKIRKDAYDRDEEN